MPHNIEIYLITNSFGGRQA